MRYRQLWRITRVEEKTSRYICLYLYVYISVYIIIKQNKNLRVLPPPRPLSLPRRHQEPGRRRVASIKRAINQLAPLPTIPPKLHFSTTSAWAEGPASGGVRLISRVRLRSHSRREVRRRGRGGRKQRSWHRPSCQVGFLARFSLEMCIFWCVSGVSSGIWAVLPVCV